MTSRPRGRGSCLAFNHIKSPAKVHSSMVSRSITPWTAAGAFSQSGHTRVFAAEASIFEAYDVNTIANCEPDIIPCPDTPPTHGGRPFARADQTPQRSNSARSLGISDLIGAPPPLTFVAGGDPSWPRMLQRKFAPATTCDELHVVPC